ncbi:hypothetical protein VS868_03715 [Salinimicrobium sp. 3283s]|uniref:hypothetical protein n=1 Tax=Salinimicrobium sp. 3283s TaxID=3114359 RepID=UPI0031EAD436
MAFLKGDFSATNSRIISYEKPAYSDLPDQKYYSVFSEKGSESVTFGKNLATDAQIISFLILAPSEMLRPNCKDHFPNNVLKLPFLKGDFSATNARIISSEQPVYSDLPDQKC